MSIEKEDLTRLQDWLKESTDDFIQNVRALAQDYGFSNEIAGPDVLNVNTKEDEE